MLLQDVVHAHVHTCTNIFQPGVGQNNKKTSTDMKQQTALNHCYLYPWNVGFTKHRNKYPHLNVILRIMSSTCTRFWALQKPSIILARGCLIHFQCALNPINTGDLSFKNWNHRNHCIGIVQLAYSEWRRVILNSLRNLYVTNQSTEFLLTLT